MAIIQSAVNADVTGQVGKRIWPDANPYANLWVDPGLLQIDIEEMKLPVGIVRLAGLENLSFLIDENSVDMTPSVPSVQFQHDENENPAYASAAPAAAEEDPQRTETASPARETGKESQIFGE